MVLEEANAISSTANFALMLPEPARKPILGLLRDYVAVRIGLGIPHDPAKLERDIARSLELQTKLWQQAVAVTAAAQQSLPAYRFVGSLNEMNNIHERRLTALRYHIPGEVAFMLIVVAMVAMGFTGFYAGLTGLRRHAVTLIMSLMVSVVIMLVADLDQPARGLIQVPVQPLVDAAQGIPP
jgi:type IV secretory pathway VirB2 component (pilin)